MAPYVEREWGAKATEMMWRVKALADPARDPEPRHRPEPRPGGTSASTSRATPRSRRSVGHCIECGFCEPVCPSRNTTTTPRQRIVIRREMARQRRAPPSIEALMGDFEYDADPDVRRRRDVPGRVPGGDRHRRADQGVPPPRASTRARGGGRAGRSPAATPRGERGPRGHHGRARRRRPLGRVGGRATAAAPTRALSRDLVPLAPGEPPAHGAPHGCPPPAAPLPPLSTCPRASTASSAPARRGRRARRCPRRSSRYPPARACRCGSPATSPAIAAPPPGARRATAAASDTWRRRRRRRCGAGATAGACPSSSTRARARSACARNSPAAARTPSASDLRASSARLDRVGARQAAPAAGITAPGSLGSRASDVLGRADGPVRKLDGIDASARR